jgi:hypothetical protein
MVRLLTSGEAQARRLVDAAAPLTAGDAAIGDDLASIRETTEKVLREQIMRTKAQMQERVAIVQRILYERIPEQVGVNMRSAFQEAATQKGSGTTSRMVAILDRRAHEVSGVMFDDAEHAIVDGVGALTTWLANEYATMAATVLRHSDVMAGNLGRGASDMSPAAIEGELQSIARVAASVEHVRDGEPTLGDRVA